MNEHLVRLIDPEDTVVLVVDVQEAFRPAIDGFERLTSSVATLVQGANAFGLPVVVTEQYPKGLGRTVAEVADHLEGERRLEKTAFSAVDAEGFDLQGRGTVLICGIESHICVWQTAAGLLGEGVRVHVVEDAVSSRTPADRELGIQRIVAAGGKPTSVEMSLMELLRDARADQFKAIQQLIK